MSGFFSQIAGELEGSGAMQMAVPALLSLVMNRGPAEEGAAPASGLSGLLQQFQNAGLGQHVSSWVGSGENLPLTAQQVLGAIPPDQIDAWASKVGMSHEAVAGILAQVLPHAVDHATPDGQVPAAEAPAPDFAGLVGRLFGR